MRLPFKTYQWSSSIYACQSNDLEYFQSMVDEEVSRLGMQQNILGKIDDDSLLMYKSPAANANLPSVLVCAGFHGNESAANWGILHFLSILHPSVFKSINLTILPLINPTGFKKGYRCNRLGQDPNRGFEFVNGKPKMGDGISEEGKILLKHAQLLQAASRSGVLSCHEDVLQDGSYIYSFEPRPSPGKFSINLRDKLTEFFPSTTESEIDNCVLDNGIILNHFDTSFEAFLVKSGARFGLCSETPAMQNFDQRILANSELIQCFIDYFIEHPEITTDQQS